MAIVFWNVGAKWDGKSKRKTRSAHQCGAIRKLIKIIDSKMKIMMTPMMMLLSGITTMTMTLTMLRALVKLLYHMYYVRHIKFKIRISRLFYELLYFFFPLSFICLFVFVDEQNTIAHKKKLTQIFTWICAVNMCVNTFS